MMTRTITIGVPKEQKTHEYRVGLLPVGVEELVRLGHRVLFETGAGQGSGIADEEYSRHGAEIVANAQRKPIQYNVKDEVPPIFHVLLVMVPQATAYARDKGRYSPEEQNVVEAWILGVIKTLQKDYALTNFKLDNKQYLFGVLKAAYGYAANDKSMIDKAFKTYTTAIKGQRKDGSLPHDSGRGGSALHYSNQASQ